MQRTIKKYILVDLSEKQIELARSLMLQYPHQSDQQYWIFMNTLDELFYHIDHESIIITNDQIKEQTLGIMLNLGHPFYLGWNDFLRYHYNLMHFQSEVQEKKICLAYIPENYLKIYKTILHAYGFTVNIALHHDELEKILNSGIHYLVFDLDMEQLPERVRIQTLQKIHFHCKKGLRVNVIKNFDKGSLFNDILSPVREISNILLSPEEYILFLRKYLYVKELENFRKTNPDGLNEFLNFRFSDDTKNNIKVSPDLFSELKDSKKTYNHILSLQSNKRRNHFEEIKSGIDTRYLLSRALAKFVTHNLESSQRELFTFFSQ